MPKAPVLVSWVAVANDPYERDREGKLRTIDGQRVAGPTLTLLTDPESEYCGLIRDVVLLHQSFESAYSKRERSAVQGLVNELDALDYKVRREVWSGDDPTDHQSIFAFLQAKLPEVRERYRGRQLVVHASPGTPSMQTIWVLMAETGLIDPPFTVVKSYRKQDRRGRPAVVAVEVGIESFYKAYQSSRPRQVSSEDQGVGWNPRRFESKAMKLAFAEARRFANVKVPVLIRGERGTGKTTLANWIRSNSAYRRGEQDARWPSVVCGQYSTETMRSELFGYVKGAFTGAMSDTSGLLAAAHRDTLFLDEVGDMSRDLQRLLIRALEEKRYQRLGDDRQIESDFRLLTATNIDEVTLRDRLDPDFLDRISPLTIWLPSLREVREELSWLWEEVYAQACSRAGVSQKIATFAGQHHARIVAALVKHPLPGNIRDLFRVAYRVLAARADPDGPVPPADAVEYGLDVLVNEAGDHEDAGDPSSVAAAYARGQSLDDLVSVEEPLETEVLVADYKAYLATELRRISSSRGLDAGRLCDRSSRSLLDWTKSKDRKTSARRQKKPSGEGRS